MKNIPERKTRVLADPLPCRKTRDPDTAKTKNAKWASNEAGGGHDGSCRGENFLSWRKARTVSVGSRPALPEVRRVQ
jgi:hypothetical protein